MQCAPYVLPRCILIILMYKIGLAIEREKISGEMIDEIRENSRPHDLKRGNNAGRTQFPKALVSVDESPKDGERSPLLVSDI